MAERNATLNPRDVWLIVLLWVIATAYNLFKPYHIDDTAYLEIAKWISLHPDHPMRGLLNWYGMAEPIYRTNQPHLYFYLMAVWSRLFGFSEPAMHSLQALFSFACIALFYRLALVFARDAAVWITAILALGPAFIVEQNVMVDVPLLAIWLLFFNLILIGCRSQTQRYVLAALACSAGVLIKYSSLVLVAFLCLSLLIEKRKKLWWTPSIVVASLAGWSLFNYLDYGGIHIATRPPRIVPLTFVTVRFLINWVVTIGGVVPIGLIVLGQLNSRLIKWQKGIYALIAVGFGALVFAVAAGLLTERWSIRASWFAFMVSGCLALAPVLLALVDLIRRKTLTVEADSDTLRSFYLIAWIAGTSAFYILQAPFSAARHVLLILPPLLLIAASRLSKGLTVTSKRFAVALTVVVSAGLCASDWSYAAFYKSEATILANSLQTTGKLWTTGHWGWQWYASLAGIREVDAQKSKLEPGDYFILTESIDHQALVSPPPMRLIRSDDEGSPLHELFCTGKESAFYGYLNVRVPWYLSRSCSNRIEVYRVDGPAQAR